MFTFDYSLFQQELEQQYKQQFDWGWLDKDTLKSYVAMGILSKDGYKRIVGVEYRETRTTSPVAQS